MSDEQTLTEIKFLRAEVAQLRWLLVTFMKTDGLDEQLKATVRRMAAEVPPVARAAA